MLQLTTIRHDAEGVISALAKRNLDARPAPAGQGVPRTEVAQDAEQKAREQVIEVDAQSQATETSTDLSDAVGRRPEIRGAQCRHPGDRVLQGQLAETVDPVTGAGEHLLTPPSEFIHERSCEAGGIGGDSLDLLLQLPLQLSVELDAPQLGSGNRIASNDAVPINSNNKQTANNSFSNNIHFT